MIGSFADREAEFIFEGGKSRRYAGLDTIIERKLLALQSADALYKLAIPRGNRLEALKGDRKGQHSIRVNDQYRICFRWEGSLPTKSKLSTITEAPRRRFKRQRPPIHPGEMLREEFLVPMGLSANALAIAIGVPATRVGEIVNERRGITADTALRLGRYFHIGPEFWMNLQSRYDLENARYLSEQQIKQSVKPAPLDKKTGALKVAVAA